MVVRMRLRPTGVRNNPLYDVVVVRNQRRPRAAPIEKLGEYQSVPSLLPNPRASTSSVLQPIPDPVYEKSLKINKDRVAYWMSAGAQPSQTVSRLLTKAGLLSRDECGKQQVEGHEKPSKRAQKRAALRTGSGDESSSAEASKINAQR